MKLGILVSDKSIFLKMKYNKNLRIMAATALVISIVQLTIKEKTPAKAEPIVTVALSTLDEPIKDGLKTKIFTIADKPKDIK
jgi:hypothetical protein